MGHDPSGTMPVLVPPGGAEEFWRLETGISERGGSTNAGVRRATWLIARVYAGSRPRQMGVRVHQRHQGFCWDLMYRLTKSGGGTMPRRNLFPLLIVLSLIPAVAVAQSGTQEGRYANLNDAVVVTELPGGGELQEVDFRQVTFASDGESPLDEILSDCRGVFQMDAAGQPTHASGTCMGSSPEGDLIAWWWQMTEAATEGCSDMCGTFSLFGGHGKYAGMTGEGTWIRESIHPTGGFGTWQLEYSR